MKNFDRYYMSQNLRVGGLTDYHASKRLEDALVVSVGFANGLSAGWQSHSIPIMRLYPLVN